MRTLAIANAKGGTGKTTTAVTLAHGLAMLGQCIRLVDGDTQGQAGRGLGLGCARSCQIRRHRGLRGGES